MALKAAVTKAEYDALPEAVRALYKEQGGKFTLEVDGMSPDSVVDDVNSKLAEFRDNNRKLFGVLKEFGIDDITKAPDVVTEFKTLRTEKDKFAARGARTPDDLSAAINEAVAKAAGPLQDRIGKIEAERDQARSALDSKNFEDALWGVAAKAGVEEWAKDDVIARGRRVFKSENGKLTAYEGESPLYSKARGQASVPLSVEEWATQWLPEQAPGLFRPSKGSGARNDRKEGAAGGRILANDPLIFGQNLEAIAKGEAQVVT
jgi:hypothetical protein